MSGSIPAPSRDDAIARDVRQLPPAPSLEYERKEARALLRQLHARDATAMQRVRAAHPVALRDRGADQLRLADAQHVIAREYGFTSWPRLVGFFEELNRHRNAVRYNSANSDTATLEQFAQARIRMHQHGDIIVARELAHFVPRFYGRTAADILATPITIDDARLVVARERKYASWDELLERAAASRTMMAATSNPWEVQATPFMRALAAMRADDFATFTAILDEHPELLTPSHVDQEWRRTIVRSVLSIERSATFANARRYADLLESRGADIQHELNVSLLGGPPVPVPPADVRWYLERGADPHWIAPNGYGVLEHAIVHYRNSEAIGLIAARVRPTRALWIAAGLGDANGVRSFIAAKGRLTAAGRSNRPDTMALGLNVGLPPNYHADDLEIMWEAFQVAGRLDHRDAMDVLLDAGLPVDHAPIGFPLLIEAIGNRNVSLTEYLLSRGADLDRVWGSNSFASINGSARSFAREWLSGNLDDKTVSKLLEICGAGSPKEIAAETGEQRQSPPPPDERTLRAMQLAADDAARLGRSHVATDNMLVGILRQGNGAFASAFLAAGADMLKLKSLIGARLLPDSDPIIGQELPADADAEAAVRTAARIADEKHRQVVSVHHLVLGILDREDSPGARTLAEVGITREFWARF